MAEARRLDADLGIEGPVSPFDRAALGKRRKGVDQEIRIALVKRGQRVHGGGGIREDLSLKRLGADGVQGGGR